MNEFMVEVEGYSFLMSWLTLVLSNTVVFGIDLIPSKYRSTTAKTNTDIFIFKLGFI